jgi:hypothetical protein
VYEAWTGSRAFGGQSAAEILVAVVDQGARPQLPEDMPPDYASLVEDCWEQDAEDRPRMQDVLVCLRQMQAAVATA